jgi:hypothetical protein
VDNLDYPCVCGCLAGHHDMKQTNLFKYCLNDGCNCDDFRPDNLKYLEMKVL